ncbi:MAG: hypothetical protein HZA53_13315 [Planctomycetes bacterium]|nr:hypothetical protein [Planctomycetota bacterium]
MNPRRRTLLAVLLVLAAAGVWSWSLVRGGLARRPAPKLDRAARATPELPAGGAEASSPRDSATPYERVRVLEGRVAALEAAATARPAALDAAFARAHVYAIPNTVADPIAAEFLARAPFEGTRVRAGLRVASFGGRLRSEGDELVPGRVVLARIEAAGVVLATSAGEERVEFASGAREDGR